MTRPVFKDPMAAALAEQAERSRSVCARQSDMPWTCHVQHVPGGLSRVQVGKSPSNRLMKMQHGTRERRENEFGIFSSKSASLVQCSLR